MSAQNFIYKTLVLLMLLNDAVTTQLSKCDNVRATVTQKLLKEGFHRDIRYTVNFGAYNGNIDLWSHGTCSLSIQQVLPSGAYVNRDELDDMRRHNKLHACPVGLVDVEKPEHMSRPLTVHVYSPVGSPRIQVTLPIHLRYHKARSEGGYEPVRIGPPWVFLRCPNNVFKVCKSSKPVLSPCGPCSPNTCQWYNITTYPRNIELEMQVPIGDLDDLNFVTLGTYVVSFGGCLYVLINMLATSTAANKYKSSTQEQAKKSD